jgi:hypothetical protein
MIITNSGPSRKRLNDDLRRSCHKQRSVVQADAHARTGADRRCWNRRAERHVCAAIHRCGHIKGEDLRRVITTNSANRSFECPATKSPCPPRMGALSLFIQEAYVGVSRIATQCGLNS